MKRDPDIIDCIEGLTDFDNFGTNIPDTTGHQMALQVPTSPNICFYTTWGNQNIIDTAINEWRKRLRACV